MRATSCDSPLLTLAQLLYWHPDSHLQSSYSCARKWNDWIYNKMKSGSGLSINSTLLLTLRAVRFKIWYYCLLFITAVRIRNSASSLHIEVSTQSLSADFHTSLATQLAVLLCAYACCFMTVYHSDPACTLQDITLVVHIPQSLFSHFTGGE